MEDPIGDQNYKIGTTEAVIKRDWTEVFDAAKTLGFDGVELGLHGDDYLNTELWESGGLEALRERSQRTGVEVPSICLHSFWRFSFADRDVAHRTTAKDIVLNSLKAASELGSRTILIPVTNPNGLDKKEADSFWVEELKAVAYHAQKYESILALELVGNSHVTSYKEILNLIETVGSSSLRSYFDPTNSKSLGGDPIQDIRMLKDRIAQVHLKDTGDKLLGTGDVDLKGCVEALKEVGYRGYFILETEPTDDPDGAARHNLKYLNNLLKGKPGDRDSWFGDRKSRGPWIVTRKIPNPID